MRASESKDRLREFNDGLAAITSETIASVLGRTVWEAYANYLRNSVGFSVDEIPAHLRALFNSLRQLFGVGGDVLAKRIVKSLYAEYGIELTIREGRSLEDYVEELKERFLRGRLPIAHAKRLDTKNGGVT